MTSARRPVDIGAAAARHERELLSFALRLLGEAESAGDALQEALLRATQAVRDGAAPDNVRAWLYRLVYHAAVDRLRRRSIEEAARTRAARAGSAPAERGGQEDLERLVAALPSPQREVILLRYVHGFTYAEMEDVLSRPAASLRVFAARALDALHARAKSEDER